MNLGIKNKKVLITGAGRGLGESMARNLAAEGAKIAAVARTKKDLDVLIKEFGGEKAGHLAIVSDLTEDRASEKVIGKLKKIWGMPEIVVNNVGGNLDIKDPFCSVSDWRKIWRLNMEVGIEINNLVLPEMQKKKWGRIVHVSSIASLENQGTVPYCSVKAALTAYVRSMGRVVAAHGIIMTSILPGAVFTEGGYWDYTSKNNPEHVKKYIQERMAIQRFGKPDEIGAIVAFLCSEQASFMVGSMVPVDGGQGRVFF